MLLGCEEISMSKLRSVALLCAICVLALSTPSYTQTAAQGRMLHINNAVYGSQGHGKNVTDRLRALVRNNRIDVVVDNDSMGGDPNEHNKKTLKVDYSVGGQRRSKVVNEHDRLVLP